MINVRPCCKAGVWSVDAHVDTTHSRQSGSDESNRSVFWKVLTVCTRQNLRGGAADVQEGGAEVSTTASSTLDDDLSDDASSSSSSSSDSSGREPRSPNTVQHAPGGRRRSGSSQREGDRSDVIATCPTTAESAAGTAPLTRELLAAQDSAYQMKGSKASSVCSGE